MEAKKFQYISLLNEQSDIEILKVGRIYDRDLKITEEMLDDFIQHFKDNVYGTELQVNFSHDREGEAAGWIKDLYRVEQTLFAKVEWTPIGQEKIKNKQFRYTSSELQLRYPHHANGEMVKNVLIGVALTNVPAVKGMKEVTLSEEVESFINLQSMDKVKEMYAQLMKKDKLSKGELAAFRAACADHMAEDGVKAMMDKVVGRVDNSEGEGADDVEAAKAKADEDAAKATETASADEAKAKAEGQAELSEQMRKAGMVVLSEAALNELKANAQLGVEASSKLKKAELAEEVKSSFCLSEDRVTGFKPGDAGTVAEFMFSLSESQRAKFKEVLGLMVNVDLSERGAAGNKESSEGKFSATVLQEAQAKAEKMAKESGKSLVDCLSEVYSEMKLV